MRTATTDTTDVSNLWEIMRTPVYSEEYRTVARNKLAELYYGDCCRLAGKMWSKARMPRHLTDDWISESMTHMLTSVIPSYIKGDTKFTTFLMFCLRRRFKQFLRTKFNRETVRHVELVESTATTDPVDLLASEEIYNKACEIFGERVVEGRVVHGWTVEKMAEELDVSRATVYNWMCKLKGELQ